MGKSQSQKQMRKSNNILSKNNKHNVISPSSILSKSSKEKNKSRSKSRSKSKDSKKNKSNSKVKYYTLEESYRTYLLITKA